MSSVVIAGDTSGSITLQAPSIANTSTLTLPATTATLLTDSSGILNIGSGQVYKDASGNVGIGTSSPIAELQVNGATTYSRLKITNSTSGAGNTDGLDLLLTGSDGYLINREVGNIIVSIAGTERMRIDSSGNVTLQKNISVGAAAPTTVGTGITFPSTASPSTDAYTLDDYREGTYTPVVSSSVGTITSYSASGVYTKVGRVVTVSFTVNITNNGTGAGQIVMTLPFIIGNITGNSCSGSARENAITGLAIQIYGSQSASAVQLNYNNGYPGGTGSSFVGSFSYITS